MNRRQDVRWCQQLTIDVFTKKQIKQIHYLILGLVVIIFTASSTVSVKLLLRGICARVDVIAIKSRWWRFDRPSKQSVCRDIMSSFRRGRGKKQRGERRAKAKPKSGAWLRGEIVKPDSVGQLVERGWENGKNCVMDSSNSAQNTFKLQHTL